MFDFKFDWQEKMNTDIEIVDFQHKQFFSIGRDVEQLIMTKCAGVTDEQLLKIVCALRDYVAYHFYEEESLMQKAEYKGLEEHRKEHLEGTQKVQNIDFHRLKTNPYEGLKNLKIEMQEWIFNHMLVTDVKMAKEIKSKIDNHDMEKVKRNKRDKFTLMAVVDGIESAVKAEEAGVERIALCSNLIIGGTTPTLSLFQEVKKKFTGKIDVMIRPRSGDYHYNDYEFQLILAEIKAYKSAGADGIIIGALQQNGCLDYPQMQRMVLSAGRMNVVLNRVMDMCKEPLQTLKEAGELGIKEVITSGQKATCLEGINLIKQLKKAANNKVRIIVNCGTDGSVIRKVYEETQATEYLISGMVELESRMYHRNMEVRTGTEEFNEFIVLGPDKKRITDAMEMLDTM